MKIIFCNAALNRLVRKLDQRLLTWEGDGKFKFKKRVLANQSHLEPPVGYIPWAVQETQDREWDTSLGQCRRHKIGEKLMMNQISLSSQVAFLRVVQYVVQTCRC